MTRLVYVCSAWRAAEELERRQDRDRALRLCRDVAMAGDPPVAPHLLFPQFLDGADPFERDVGLRCALALLSRCDELRAFGEPSEGMAREIAAAKTAGVAVRRLAVRDEGALRG